MNDCPPANISDSIGLAAAARYQERHALERQLARVAAAAPLHIVNAFADAGIAAGDVDDTEAKFIIAAALTIKRPDASVIAQLAARGLRQETWEHYNPANLMELAGGYCAQCSHAGRECDIAAIELPILAKHLRRVIQAITDARRALRIVRAALEVAA